MTTSNVRISRDVRARAAVAGLAVALVMTGCSSGRAGSAHGLLPAGERSTVQAGVEQLPLNANLSISTVRVVGQLDLESRREQRHAYAQQVKLALSLVRRYVENPSRKGRFRVGGGSGPSAALLGRAAAAVTAAAAACDAAIPNAPAPMRAATLQLRAQLLTLSASVRRGDTVSPAAAAHLKGLTEALVAAGAGVHLRLHAGRSPLVVPVVVTPQWRIAQRRDISRVRHLTNSGLGAVRRYLVVPAARGRFSPTLSAGSSERVQHRAQQALVYALAQWSQAASIAARLPRVQPLSPVLRAASRTLAADLVRARGNTLSARQAAALQVLVTAITAEGLTLHVRLRPGPSPVFAA